MFVCCCRRLFMNHKLLTGLEYAQTSVVPVLNCLLFCLSVCPSILHLSFYVYRSFCLSIRLSLSLCLSFSVHLSLSLSLVRPSVRPSISLSVSVCRPLLSLWCCWHCHVSSQQELWAFSVLNSAQNRLSPVWIRRATHERSDEKSGDESVWS